MNERMPRPEYPRPQFRRVDWLCLNGLWQFEADPGDTGLERSLLDRPLRDAITVPFCPESTLSGISNWDVCSAVWYRRQVAIPAAWSGQRVLLHMQAVDYDATVWVNGKQVGRHRGGFTPFTLDLTSVAIPGETITLVIRARDDNHRPQPRGKQSRRYHPHEALYPRTTGIWQTVWLEPVPHTYFLRPRITPNYAESNFHIEFPLRGVRAGLRVRAILSDDNAGEIVRAEAAADRDFTPSLMLSIPKEHVRAWSPDDPYLYDLHLELVDSSGAVVDQLASYAGLRSITIDGMAVRLNGEVLFQRLVLDQGYYPDGMMTAPDDDALRRDIELAQAAGFNGARLHQKVFEERFLYHADRLGYLVWGEFADWGARDFGPKHDHHRHGPEFITQWLEALERDYSHPCIVGWCPLNETWQSLGDEMQQLDDITRGLYLATKAMDGTRPVIDASGGSHREPLTDIWDVHDYAQHPPVFAGHYACLVDGEIYGGLPDDGRVRSVPYDGQPYMVSEFGGIWWNADASDNESSWGYGERPESIEAFYRRFEGLVTILLDNLAMFGYCYTQLTDVYQEQNGIYTFDRRPKFDTEHLHNIQQRAAAIERDQPRLTNT